MNFFGGRRGVILGYCAVMALFSVVWGERNRRIFENLEGDEIESGFGHRYGHLHSLNLRTRA